MTRKLATAVLIASLGIGFGACSGGGGDSEAFCDAGRQIEARFDDLDSDADAFTDLRAAFDDVAGDVPAEIKAEFDEVRDALDALAGIDVTDPDALAAAVADIDQAKFAQAENAIGQWFEDNCSS